MTNIVRVNGRVINPDDTPLILTFSGKYVNPLDLKPDDITVVDIAAHLANHCRYTGATRYKDEPAFYSVAQHSILVSRLVPEEIAYEGLFHDAAEHTLIDLARPVKYDEYFGKAYRGAQKRAEKVINDTLGLQMIPEVKALVKKADMLCLAWERRDLMHPNGEWEILKGIGPLPDAVIEPWAPKRSFRQFMKRYEEVKHLGRQG